MKNKSSSSSSGGEEKVVLPWEAELEVKDLIRPITVRRIRIVQTVAAVLLFFALLGVAWWYVVKPETGAKILEDMVMAAGGMNEWQNIKDGSFVRTHHRYDENGKIIKESVETFYFLNTNEGHKLLIKSSASDGADVLVGHDQTGYWASLNGKQTNPVILAKDMEFMCDDDGCSPLCASEMALYRMSFPFKLKDNGVIPRNAGTATLNGDKVQVLDVTFDPKVGHDRWVFLVDPASKYIRKIEHYPSVKENAQPEEIFLSDFKKEGNIMLSHANKYYRSNGKILEEYLVSDVKFNDGLSASMFDRPQDITMK
ncbi:MAG: hypothetical protein ABIT96_03340 [Ferruginibacter sp.]